MLDLDHFKHCNDTYGHQAGDEVLRQVAPCMKDVVHHAGFAARYGGEEFVVIVARKAAKEIHELAEEIRRTIERKIVRLADRELQITASLGTTCLASPAPAVTPGVPP